MPEQAGSPSDTYRSAPVATGERLIPEAYQGELVHAEHLARYRLAARLASGRRVLDAACGEGYGSAMLDAAGAAEVIGVDIDAATVRHARERYALDAREGDVTALPLPDSCMDLVVSFETIEHVAEPERALDEFRRVLAPDGVLLVSTPNTREYLDDNPFHLRELTTEEFLGALRERFTHVRALYQQNYLLSAVLDETALAERDPDPPRRLEVSKLVGLSPGRELYTVALCGVAELPDLTVDVAVAADIHEAHRLAEELREWPRRAAQAERLVGEWTARAHEAERVLTEWTERAATAEHLVGEWEARARLAEAETATYRERADEAERLVGEWQARATEAERQVHQLRENLMRMRSSLSWRLTKPLRWRRALAARRARP
ncbi:MAG TPA: methyltransferase domain-containing protein [Solirubrobacteraceae bacterium]|jgi:SAM-dependent methyltransferase|nr:methyltransferase domain-containing protein [Solirubrobacteraceae bacterium]